MRRVQPWDFETASRLVKLVVVLETIGLKITIGINQIFNFRIDEEVSHEPELAKKLKKADKPDRVYGLRQTRNIENLLFDTVRQQDLSSDTTDQIQDVLGYSPADQPMSQHGDRLLFPFLVLEAKSGSSSDDWHSIQMQTAFVVRTLLETQNRLRTAAGSESTWKSGPLVWFLMNKGEDWRVSAAYVEVGPKRPNTVGIIDYTPAHR
ncbi:hypothetical protein ACHAQA_009230 [Verticillium albo-atrum]